MWTKIIHNFFNIGPDSKIKDFFVDFGVFKVVSDENFSCDQNRSNIFTCFLNKKEHQEIKQEQN